MTIELLAEIRPFVEQAIASSNQLPIARQELLGSAGRQIAALAKSRAPVHLLFVCTHNSRRSQFSQFWAAVATQLHTAGAIRSHSCGTEATSCNPRTVQSLVRSGVQIETVTEGENPLYHCRCTTSPEDPIELFSKAFGHPSLPSDNLVALMCCDDADEKCPVVPGAQLRVPLHYVDPKRSDDTSQENATYDERSMQIASEMLFLIRTTCEHG